MAEAEKLGPNVPPDTGQSDKVSYAERLKTNIRYDQRLKRNEQQNQNAVCIIA